MAKYVTELHESIYSRRQKQALRDVEVEATESNFSQWQEVDC